jgi:predicted extracellular nuclease
MSKRSFKVIHFTLVGLIFIFSNGHSQESGNQPVTVMFYNVENLFDIYNDSTKDDDDFLPDGLMRWNLSRYNKKISSLYKTIVAAGKWNLPAVVSLCEIENRKVLEDLVYGTYLSKYNYRIIHEESPDQRGIDVCMIYRKDIVNIIEYTYWIPPVINDEIFTSRSVLYTKMVIKTDTVHVIVNHWPSRRGGVLAGEGQRMKIAGMIRQKADSIFMKNSRAAKIIILGDFNCTPDDQVIKSLMSSADSGRNFINLSERMATSGTGSYRYMGTWEMIDQIMVSGTMLNSKSGLFTTEKTFRVFNPDFLLKKDPSYPGLSPLSTYRGYKYQGGYSDHLPVLIDLMFRHPRQQE